MLFVYTAGEHIIATIDLVAGEMITECGRVETKASLTPIVLEGRSTNAHLCGACLNQCNDRILKQMMSPTRKVL